MTRNINIIPQLGRPETEGSLLRPCRRVRIALLNDFGRPPKLQTSSRESGVFLDNARDTHPAAPQSSLDRLCGVGRNEGVPSPSSATALATSLIPWTARAYYSPSSNQGNLQNSGPYKYQDPTLLYST